MDLAALAWVSSKVLSAFFVYSIPFKLVFNQIEHAHIICRSALPS